MMHTRLYRCRADRYLLRHETYNDAHYRKLHPVSLSARHRQNCLWDLKSIGYQIGTGFMVGAPFQTTENLTDDMLFLKELNPHMVGIGPFIPHHDTQFASEPAGTLELTLYLLGLIRLMLPKVLLPAQPPSVRFLPPEGNREFSQELMSLCQTFLQQRFAKIICFMITRSAPVMNRHSARTAWPKEWSLSDIMLL